MTETEKVWQIAANRLQMHDNKRFKLWFSKLIPLELNADIIILNAPDKTFAEMVEEQYGNDILKSLKDIDGVDYTFNIVSDRVQKEELYKEVKPVEIVKKPQEDNSKQIVGNNFTFNNFVVGAENRHAYAAARTAAEQPGFYNPLYIYGVSGIGKTHLLHAVKNSIEEAHPKMIVRFATCDELLNDFYELLVHRRSLSEFRNSIREVDVLLVDDVHSLAKKTQMQEEFFNMFDTLYNQQKQIILTSDKQPCEIADLDKRLESRFESGVTAEIGAPEFEARLAILKMTRDEMNMPIPLSDEILEFLATNISSSVRRLKGAHTRLVTFVSMTGTANLSIHQAEEILHSQLLDECSGKVVTIEAVQNAVTSHFGISLAELLSDKRSKEYAEPRMLAMYLCRELTEESSSIIGQGFGRDHATILHAVKRVPDLCKKNDAFRRSLKQLRNQLMRN